MKIDRSNLTTEQVAQLDQWEATQKQVKTLLKVSSTLDKMSGTLSKKTDKELCDAMGEVKSSIDKLAAKDVSIPDYAAPVVKALYTLQREMGSALKSLDVKPPVNVEAPNVNVDAPKLDLSGVEKLLKTTIPQAFEAAIKQIPTPKPVDNSEIVSRLETMLEQLESIDTATRMKPLPGSIKVTNMDGSAIGTAPVVQETYAQRIDDTAPPVTYIGKASPGTATATASWQIQKVDETSGTVITWADGDSNFNNVWDNRASLSYS